jgi:ParB family chromosome partitioning protein
VTNPFHQSLESFRGKHVRVVSNDGRAYEGWIERIHHHDRHVVLRGATDLETGDTVGGAMVAHADVIQEVDPDTRIEELPLDAIQPAPYHARKLDASDNRGYIADVRENGWAGSFPVVRPIGDGEYEVVEGHKRLWVAEQAGLDSHPVEIDDVDEWTATQRFVADHLPDERHVRNDGNTSDGYYGADAIEVTIRSLADEWGARILELDRVQFNGARLGLEFLDELEDDQPEGADQSDVDQRYECDECDFATDSETGLAIHEGRLHSTNTEDDVGDDVDEIWCGVCGAGPFESTTNLSGHHNGAGHEGSTDPVEDPPSGADRADLDDSTDDIDEETLVDVAEWTPKDDDQGEWTDYSTENAGNGNECQNCGSHVPKKFSRVFEPESEGAPRCCPKCTDLVRDADGTIREARSTAGRGSS